MDTDDSYEWLHLDYRWRPDPQTDVYSLGATTLDTLINAGEKNEQHPRTTFLGPAVLSLAGIAFFTLGVDRIMEGRHVYDYLGGAFSLWCGVSAFIGSYRER